MRLVFLLRIWYTEKNDLRKGLAYGCFLGHCGRYSSVCFGGFLDCEISYVKGEFGMNKILKNVLIAVSAFALLVLLCLGLYSIGYLDLFVFFVVPGGLILGALACLIWNIYQVLGMRKRGEPVPRGKKLMLIVCSVILVTVVLAIVALIAVFAMAIAFM